MGSDKRGRLSPVPLVGVYGVWLAVSGVAALVAWQLHASFIFLAAGWLAGDRPNPLGWTSATLPGLEKLSVLVFGSAWLLAILYWERAFPRWAEERRLGRQLLRLLGGMALLLGAAYGLVFLAGS